MKQLDKFEREALDYQQDFLSAKKNLYHYIFMYIRVMQAEFGLKYIPLYDMLSCCPSFINNNHMEIEDMLYVRQKPNGENIIEVSTDCSYGCEFFDADDCGEIDLVALLDALVECRAEIEKKLVDGYRIVTVDWDVDDPDDGSELPEVVFIPKSVEDDNVSDWLSDEYGFCVNGWS